MASGISSLKDIAKAANVSIPTVSRILRRKNLTRFNEETRNRVLEAAARLRYRPNMLVKGMQTGFTHTIGVMVPPFDSYWSEVLYGIHDALIFADYVPIILWTRHDENYRSRHLNNLEQIHRLIDRRIDGTIMWPPTTPDYYDHHHEFAALNVPVITIDHELPKDCRADSVTTNEKHGSQLVAKHLLDLGHRRIAFLGDVGLDKYSWSHRRRTFFEDEISSEPKAEFIAIEKNPMDDGVSIAEKLITSKVKPTAIYAASDLLARFVYLAADKLGLRIPEDISVVGFADLDFAPLMAPALTSVRQKGYEIGNEAVRILINRIQGKYAESGIQSLKMDCELVVRDSSGPVRKD